MPGPGGMGGPGGHGGRMGGPGGPGGHMGGPGGMRGPGGPGMHGGRPIGGPGGPPPPRHGGGFGFGRFGGYRRPYRNPGCLGGCLTFILGAGGIIALMVFALAAIF